MQQLAAERIHHADGAIPHRAHNVVLEAALVDQLVDQHPLVDQRNVEIAGVKLPVAIFHLARIGDHALETVLLEEVGEENELVPRWNVGPVYDRDARGFARSAPLAECCQQ